MITTYWPGDIECSDALSPLQILRDSSLLRRGIFLSHFDLHVSSWVRGFIAAWAFVLLCRCSIAQEWGDLQGRVVWSGEIPNPAALEITRDEEVCGGIGLRDESLLVNPKNRGLANVVVWLSSKDEVPVHPDSTEGNKPVRLDNKDCRFVPRIALLRTDQTLECTNSDPIAHNVAVYGRRNQPFSIVVPHDKPLERSFPREELMPIRVDCSIHAWMRAHILITEHPYAAVTNADGEFQLKNLPVGTWTFRFWHEVPGYVPMITTDSQTVTLSRGQWERQISPGTTNLGELKLEAATFRAP